MKSLAASDFDVFAVMAMPIVANYARRRLYPIPAQDLDDIVTAVMMVAWRRRDDMPVGAEMPWIIGVTRGVLANERRKVYRRLNFIKSQSADTTHVSAESQVMNDLAVRDALATMNVADREILMLHFWENLGIDDIATLLGATANATAVRLTRAKQRFVQAFRAITNE